MQGKTTVLRHAQEIAGEVWRKMGDTNLAAPEKLGEQFSAYALVVCNRRRDRGIPFPVDLLGGFLQNGKIPAFFRHSLCCRRDGDPACLFSLQPLIPGNVPPGTGAVQHKKQSRRTFSA